MAPKPTPQQPRPLVELGPKGHYRLPPLVQIRGVAFPPGEVLTQLHLVLETGHELDMPLTRAVAEKLHSSLTAILEG